MALKDKIVISIGGSLVVPQGGIDTSFLSELNTFIRSQIANNPQRQFFLVIGGGTTARHYRDAGETVLGQKLTDEDLDWLGVHATHLNGHLVRTIFHDIAYPVVIQNYDVIRKPEEQVVVAAGWKPGWSTDYDAVLLCEDYRIHTVINMSNIDKAYDKDPKKFNDAKPIDHATWPEFRRIVGDTWSPGLNTPFDPVATKKAAELGVKLIILGANFQNLENAIEGKDFTGTVIE